MTDISGPKILLIDIETSYLVADTWGIYQSFIPPDNIREDWNILSFCAKWHNKPEITYRDLRNAKNTRDDRRLMPELYKLFDEADVVLGQNSKKFDVPRINARLAINGYIKPYSSIKQLDTKLMCKKNFGFTSYSLAYLTKVLKTKHQKLEHSKFPGKKLWDECLAGNLAAWKEMEAYNRNDVLALEDVYNIVRAWDTSLNFDLFRDTTDNVCGCGSTKFHKNGYCYTSVGRYQRFSCAECGAETRGKTNLLSPEKKNSLRQGVVR